MTRTSPLDRLLALMNDDDPAAQPITLATEAELATLRETVRPVLSELSQAELKEGTSERLARFSLPEGGTFLLQVADAIPALPAIAAAVKATPQELVSIADLMTRLSALERSMALYHEGADTGLLHALAVGEGYINATLDAVTAVVKDDQVPEPLRTLLVSKASELAERARPVEAKASAAVEGGEARAERDDAQEIKDFVAAVRGGKVATLALPGAAARKKATSGKARGARSLQ